MRDAVRLVQNTSADVAQYADVSAAKAAGYIPVTSPGYPVVHYVKISYMQDRYVLDPSHVDSLVYVTTPYGTVLAAAMYLMPRVGEPGPMPAGCMLQWHSHVNLCRSTTTGLVDGLEPCRPGSVPSGPTSVMSHVWQVPVPGGPLTLDPSDLQTVEAAVIAHSAARHLMTRPRRLRLPHLASVRPTTGPARYLLRVQPEVRQCLSHPDDRSQWNRPTSRRAINIV